MNRTPLQFRILDQGINIRCDDDLFRQLALANYAAFREPVDTADIEYTVVRHPTGGFSVSGARETLAQVDSDEDVQYAFMYVLEKIITIDLQHLRTDLYFVHASTLERGGRVILIAAESGTGKSTTAWALLQHGFSYLSDELAPIAPGSLEVHPYPHALCLKTPPPGPYALPDGITRTEKTLHIPVADLPAPVVRQPAPLHALVFLRRDTTVSAAAITEVSPAEAGARLYANTLNALAHPGSGLDVAIEIASAVPAFLVDAGDLRATCELISDIEQKL